MHRIAKSGFHLSLVSYLVFWLLDALRPGFVSRSFSVHLFLLAAVAFGIWWGITVKEYFNRPFLQLGVVCLFGIMLAVIAWNFGHALGGIRVLVSLIALLTPFLFWKCIRE